VETEKKIPAIRLIGVIIVDSQKIIDTSFIYSPFFISN